MKMKDNKRRSFFQMIGLGAMVAGISSAMPTKALGSSKKKKSNFKIESHPNSVARGK